MVIHFIFSFVAACILALVAYLQSEASWCRGFSGSDFAQICSQGQDRQIGFWQRLGFDVCALDNDAMASPKKLAAFDSIVIGIFALKFRQGLAQAMPHLHEWVQHGGTLLTLYHRPWDNWDPDATPPARIEIGQPSLRWRVTDEASEVTHLVDHPAVVTIHFLS